MEEEKKKCEPVRQESGDNTNGQSDYEAYCQQQLDDMLDSMEGRCFGDMAEGQFVRSH